MEIQARQMAPTAVPKAALPLSCWHTCLSPDGQVLLLLDVQHDLQAAAHASCPARKGALRIRVEGITLPIASIDLGVREKRGAMKGEAKTTPQA